VCGSASGSLFGSAHGSVRAVSTIVCGSVRAVRAAVCGSVLGSAWQCA
jgi:hypothetical protein